VSLGPGVTVGIGVAHGAALAMKFE